jgi:hypothetical protein
LLLGNIDQPGLFPHLDELRKAPYVFEIDFGLLPLFERKKQSLVAMQQGF